MIIKKAIYIVSILILASCTDDDNVTNPLIVGDNCLRGTGAIISEMRDLGSFTGIQNSIPANVFVSQGPVEAVRIDSPSNILENIITTVDNNTLNIRVNECIEDVDNIAIFATIPDIERLVITGVGNMSTTGAIDVDDLNILLTGVGNFNLEGSADELEISLMGVGDINAFELNSNICNIDISGVGNAELLVNDELNVTITGAGTVFYRGTPSLTTTITGDGAVEDAN